MLKDFYNESVEQSGNILRLVLQHISNQKLPFNPIAYAVWYEYAAGRNKKLSLEMQKRMEKGLDNDQVIDLFRKYIAEEQLLSTETTLRKFHEILSEIAKQLGDSGGELDAHDSSFQVYAQRLGQATTMESITEIAAKILEETREVIESTRHLKTQLEATKKEVQTLRSEMQGIKQSAVTDVLTGLLNRRGLEEIMARVFEHVQSNNSSMCVAIIDIDHFKKVNDTHGHLIGDNVLKMLATVLKDHIKGKDTAARYGGEEFLIVLPDTQLKGAWVLCEQIRKKLEKMKWIARDTKKNLGSITISIGIAQYRLGETVETLVERADKGLYFAKEHGRNQTITEEKLD